MKQKIQKLAGRISRLTGLLILSSTTLVSQPSVSNQVITLEVLELNKVFLSKDLLPLEPVAVPWNRPDGMIIAGQSRLIWTSNGDTRKISVSSRHASESCVVRIELSVARGFAPAGGKLELTDSTTRDFIRGLSKSAGSCDLRFHVLTKDQQGALPHAHVVVYTVTTG